jgi:serine/threonine-protein kinase
MGLPGSTPTSSDVLERKNEQLGRVLASKTFAKAPEARNLLAFLAKETLDGHSDLLSEKLIGEKYYRREGFDPLEDAIVRASVSRVRRKLEQYQREEGAQDPLWLEIPPGQYKVSFNERPTGETDATPVPHGAAAQQDQTGWRRNGIAAVIVCALAGLWVAHRAPADRTIRSIVVLPFINLSQDPQNDYFSDGLTEELISAFSKVEGLRVVARSSAFHFRGKGQDLLQIREKLNVQAVIEGSVRMEGNALRVTAQLIDTQSGYLLWSETYDREIKDVFTIPARICRDIIDTSKIRVSGLPARSPVKRYSEDLEAYTLCWRGRYEANKRTLDGVYVAIDYFLKLIAKEPRYALAYTGLADAFILLGSYDVLRPAEAFPKAREAALSALQIDDALSEGHTALAAVKSSYEWDWRGAEAEFEQAIALDPGYTTARIWYAQHLSALGRHTEALEQLRRALEVDPLSSTVNYVLAFTYYLAREYDRVIEQCAKIQELDSAFPMTPFILGYAYQQKRMHPEAIATFQKGIARAKGHGKRYLGHAFGVAGRRDEALVILQELQECSRRQYVSPYDFALVYLGLGDREQALAWLEQACKERLPWMTDLNVDPRFDGLRADARFQALVRKIGLVQPG